MSNLGKYQDIVIEAARQGGVDNLIKTIEDSAVADAAPKIFVKGAIAGAVVCTAVAVGAQHLWAKSRARVALANDAADAKEQLRAAVNGSTKLGDVNVERGEGSDDSDPESLA